MCYYVLLQKNQIKKWVQALTSGKLIASQLTFSNRNQNKEWKKLLEKLYEDLPEYYPTMYRDGFTPEQILMAQRKKMTNEYLDNEVIDEVNITSEVKIKWDTTIRKTRRKRKTQS